MGEIVTVVAEMDAEQTRNGDSAVDGKALRRESSLGLDTRPLLVCCLRLCWCLRWFPAFAATADTTFSKLLPSQGLFSSGLGGRIGELRHRVGDCLMEV